MPDDIGSAGTPSAHKRGERDLQVARVPEDNGDDEQVETGRAVDPVLNGAVAAFAEAVKEDRARRCMSRLAPVQAGAGAAAQLRIPQPVEHERRSLQPPGLAEGEREAALARTGGRPLQRLGSRPAAGAR